MPDKELGSPKGSAFVVVWAGVSSDGFCVTAGEPVAVLTASVEGVMEDAAFVETIFEEGIVAVVTVGAADGVGLA